MQGHAGASRAIGAPRGAAGWLRGKKVLFAFPLQGGRHRNVSLCCSSWLLPEPSPSSWSLSGLMGQGEKEVVVVWVAGRCGGALTTFPVWPRGARCSRLSGFRGQGRGFQRKTPNGAATGRERVVALWSSGSLQISSRP